MFVLEVLPLARSAPQGTLSYRSTAAYPPGTLVSVPLRKSQVRGVVVACVPVQEAKALIKRATFALKRSAGEAVRGALPEAMMRAAEAVAAYHAAPLGSVLHALLSEALPAETTEAAAGPGFRTQAIEAPWKKRIDAYRALIKQAEGTTVLVAPTLVELERLAGTFEEFAPVPLSGALTAKKRAAALAAALHAELVIATPAFSWVPVAKLGALVLERASAAAYRGVKRPHLDHRAAARELAEARGAVLAYGDYPLPLELRADPAAALAHPPANGARIIDASAERVEGEAFRAVPKAILAELGKATARGGRAAVLAARKGYAPAVVCRDCGHAVRDEEGRALGFYQEYGERLFRSADGKTVRAADTACAVCGSWNLLPLGIGVERALEEVRDALPDARVVLVDAEALKTPRAVRATRKKMREPGVVIVGTEAMLPLLDPAEPLDYAAVASADSLLALPFWRARERFAHAGLTLLDRAKRVAVATRRREDAAAAFLEHPEDGSFFAEEASLRKALGYPPYKRLIVFHAEVPTARAEDAAKRIASALGSVPYARLPDRRVRTRARVSVIAKAPADAWPDPALAARVATLPPWVSVAVDTESLW
jgi:primosomal protein N' (replication factor Y)